GEVEAERGTRLDGGFRILAGLSLEDLAGVLTRAAVFIGNDSGPGHLSAVLGTPTVSVFLSTDPQVWAPLGPRVRVIGAGVPTRPAPAPGSCPWQSTARAAPPEVAE